MIVREQEGLVFQGQLVWQKRASAERKTIFRWPERGERKGDKEEKDRRVAQEEGITNVSEIPDSHTAYSS